MSGFSTNGTQPPSLVERLKRVTWSRVLAMAGLIALGLVLVNVFNQGSPQVSKDEAVAIGRKHVAFEPTGHQIRFVRRGIPSRGYWVVSYYVQKKDGGYSKITVVLIDATTGQISEVRRS